MSDKPRTLIVSVIYYRRPTLETHPPLVVEKDFNRIDDCMLYLDSLPEEARVTIVLSASRRVAQSALSYAHER